MKTTEGEIARLVLTVVVRKEGEGVEWLEEITTSGNWSRLVSRKDLRAWETEMARHGRTALADFEADRERERQVVAEGTGR